jgi:hypothetical protein
MRSLISRWAGRSVQPSYKGGLSHLKLDIGYHFCLLRTLFLKIVPKIVHLAHLDQHWICQVSKKI